MNHLFLSPHLDDVALSAGGLVHSLTMRGETPVIATAATADRDPTLPLSLLAQDLHRKWDLGEQPYRARRDEDLEACRILCAQSLHGGLYDAIYRISLVDGRILYETVEALFGGVLASGDPIVSELESSLREWMTGLRPSRLYVPLGVGRHVDHVAMNAAARRVAAELNTEVWLYEDFPYAVGEFPEHAPDSVAAALQRSDWQTQTPEIVRVGLEEKYAAIKAFGTQLNVIFPPGKDARAFIENYAVSVGGDCWAERYWPAH
jgi:LmbE family N-acetylglucosaminyl deacetylase